MSSRQDEKARRRAEREELERKQAAKAAGARRAQIAGGVVLVLAVIGAIIVIAASGGGGNDKSAAKPATSAKAGVTLPPVRETNLAKAAAAAGCKILNPPDEGNEHKSGTISYAKSATNPPASGPHNPVAAEDGIYTPGNEPGPEHWVHSLEHGRIEIQYAPGTPTRTINQLEALGSEPFNGSPGYHVLVLENNTKMSYAVAAVAWTHVLGCPKMNDKVFDAVRAFRKQWTDQAPERIP